MNAEAFLGNKRKDSQPTVSEWLAALVKIAIGLGLMLLVAPRWIDERPLLAAGAA